MYFILFYFWQLVSCLYKMYFNHVPSSNSSFYLTPVETFLPTHSHPKPSTQVLAEMVIAAECMFLLYACLIIIATACYIQRMACYSTDLQTLDRHSFPLFLLGYYLGLRMASKTFQTSASLWHSVPPLESVLNFVQATCWYCLMHYRCSEKNKSFSMFHRASPQCVYRFFFLSQAYSASFLSSNIWSMSDRCWQASQGSLPSEARTPGHATAEAWLIPGN